MAQRGDRTRVPPVAGACAAVLPDSRACTDQRTARDSAGGVHGDVCRLRPAAFPGHINWMPATYTGRVTWAMLADDGDVNLALVPDDPFRGSTAGNLRARRGGPHIYLEFAANETVDRFASDWWRRFRHEAAAWVTSSDDGERVDRLLGAAGAALGARAVAVGLLGLDCEQDCKTELHPIYALAIEVDPEPRNNTWVLFARNWGTEGYCSRNNHLLETADDVLRMTLPGRGNAAPAIVADRSEFASSYPQPIPALSYRRGEGVTVSFHLPPPRAAGVSELVLRLDWTGQDGSRSPGGESPVGPLPHAHSGTDVIPLAVAEAGKLGPSNARIALPSSWTFTPHQGELLRRPIAAGAEPDVLGAKARADRARLKLLCAQLGTGESVPDGWRRICSQ